MEVVPKQFLIHILCDQQLFSIKQNMVCIFQNINIESRECSVQPGEQGLYNSRFCHNYATEDT